MHHRASNEAILSAIIALFECRQHRRGRRAPWNIVITENKDRSVTLLDVATGCTQEVSAKRVYKKRTYNVRKEKPAVTDTPEGTLTIHNTVTGRIVGEQPLPPLAQKAELMAEIKECDGMIANFERRKAAAPNDAKMQAICDASIAKLKLARKELEAKSTL